jgi:bifunctional UDP-N-acetylglucosamine pyrophosphorylase/glucosamine-1-phosphate N-acetyltransferase
MIEKPPANAPPTDLNNAGIYVFEPFVFPLLHNTPLSPRGEIELTAPIIQEVARGAGPTLVRMGAEEFWCDVGTAAVYEVLVASPPQL